MFQTVDVALESPEKAAKVMQNLINVIGAAHGALALLARFDLDDPEIRKKAKEIATDYVETIALSTATALNGGTVKPLEGALIKVDLVVTPPCADDATFH